MDPAAVVRAHLATLGARVAARDLDGTVDLYEADAVLAGTMGNNVGAAEIRAYVERVVTAPDPLSWEWGDVVAEQVGDVVWFFVPGAIVFGDRSPFRLSGVLRRGDDGAWRFAQFHGSIPG